AQGLDASALAAEMEKRWADGSYRVPAGAGVSYMVAPVMRAVGPPDLQVHTMTMPHLMFYAPGVTDADIGAKPDLADKASLAWPGRSSPARATTRRATSSRWSALPRRRRSSPDNRTCCASCAHTTRCCACLRPNTTERGHRPQGRAVRLNRLSGVMAVSIRPA